MHWRRRSALTVTTQSPWYLARHEFNAMLGRGAIAVLVHCGNQSASF